MAVNMRIVKLLGAVLSAVIIVVCGGIIISSTHKEVNPQTFNGKVTIVSLTTDATQPWGKSCKVRVKDEKKRELDAHTRSDVCYLSHPGDSLTMDAGQIVLQDIPKP